MKKSIFLLVRVLVLTVACFSFSSFYTGYNPPKSFRFPYKQAGLTERQAAAHLLSRFTFGAKPGDVDVVVNEGLENWFSKQLKAGLADDSLNQLLSGYEALTMTNAQIVSTFPRPGQVLKMAQAKGIISKDSVATDKKEYKEQVAAYMQQNGMKPQRDLFRQMINQKILRATVSNNQLQEVLTDFWFNHFNVSLTKNQCAAFIPSYERDVIRPNVFGKFEDLLIATAKSPAMLAYLDNFMSAGSNENIEMQLNPRAQKQMERMKAGIGDSAKGAINKLQQKKKEQGLNENYAREVMELHTLGVDGGYTQQDVTQAARVLTGWTIYPIGENGYGNAIKKIIDRVGEEKLIERGFVHEGDFLFAANRHDGKEKVVLGRKFNNSNGYNEGVELLKMLAHHPSTAKFISRKIAVRFVSDQPSQALVDNMARTFLEKDGDVRQVLLTMVSSPEFWSKNALREKTKSPFELAISAVRALDAKVNQPFQLYNWINRMGQNIYAYQAPTGFPDRGQYWINTGSLLNRMNFGLALSSQRIPGIKIDLAALNNHHEPESSEAALNIYTKLVLPERDVQETVKRLTPLLNDPDLEKKIDVAASKATPNIDKNVSMNDGAQMDDMVMSDNRKEQKPKEKVAKKNLGSGATLASLQSVGSNSMLSQVVGIIIGSPEFQRK